MSEPGQSLEEYLFEGALAKPSQAERETFLDGVCRDNPGLRARLEVLLEGHLQAEGFLADATKKAEVKPAAPPAELPSERYRSPLQWMFRMTRHDVQIHGETIPAGKVALVMIGSATRDPKHFPDANRFDITPYPNPHLVFGRGIHFCLGASLARLEAKIALAEFLARINDFKPGHGAHWEPREGLHVHGPTSLPLQFKPNTSSLIP
jgi:hypothetical protein